MGSRVGGGDDGEQLYALMQVCKPSRVQVRRADGSTQAIAMLRHRGRYTAASKAAASMLEDGGAVELLDSGGAVLRVWRPDDAADDEPAPSKLADLDGRDERLLALLVRAQDHATQAQREATRDLLAAQSRMVDATVARLASMEKSHSAMLNNLYQLTTDAAQAQADAMMREAQAVADVKEAKEDETANDLMKQVVPLALAKFAQGGTKP
jgi:hypothetical protein